MKRTVLALAAAALVGLWAQAASAFTISVFGTVTGGTDLVSNDPLVGPPVGNAFTGTMTFGSQTGVTTSPAGTGGTAVKTDFDQVNWNFTIDGVAAPITGAATGWIENVHWDSTAILSKNEDLMTIQGGTDVFLQLEWVGTTVPISLSHFPRNDAAGIAFFGVPVTATSNNSVNDFTGLRTYTLSITSFTSPGQTPIPATVWLFLSALGGLGLVARRARGRHPAGAPTAA